MKRLQFVSSICAAVIVSTFASGCTRILAPNDVPSGSITGLVSLGSETRSTPMPLASSAGVSVTLDQTGYSTTTDSNGYWRIDHVAAGNYDVSVRKPGFGFMHVFGVTVAGPGTAHVNPIALGMTPSSAPQLSAASIATVVYSADSQGVHYQQVLRVRWSAPLDRNYAGLAVFIDRDSTRQPGDVHLYTTMGLPRMWDGWYTNSITADSLPHSTDYNGVLQCPIDALHKAGITSGSTVYLSLAQWDSYSGSWSGNYNNGSYFSEYYDPNQNQFHPISPSPKSNVVAIVMP